MPASLNRTKGGLQDPQDRWPFGCKTPGVVTQPIQQTGLFALLSQPFCVVGAVMFCGARAIPLAAGAQVGPALTVALAWCVLLAGRGSSTAFGGRIPTTFARLLGPLSLATVFFACQLRAQARVDDYRHDYERLASFFEGPARCAGSATIKASPTFRSAETTSGGEKQQLVMLTARVKSIDCEGKKLPPEHFVRLSVEAANVFAPGAQEAKAGRSAVLARGDTVSFVAQLAPRRLFRNGPLTSPWPGAARRRAVLSGRALYVEKLARGQGLRSWVDRARAHVRERIFATYSPRLNSLGRALVLGESDLDDNDRKAFSKSGLMHLLAVSGTHLVLSVLAVSRLLQSLLVRLRPLCERYDMPRVSSLLAALLSLAYADFSGGSGSAWRAALMLCLICGGRALGFRVGGSAALGASMVLGLAIDPLASHDYSFVLSALATAGLIAMGQPFSRWAQTKVNWGPGRLLVESLVATLSSTIFCAPVLCLMSDELTVAALLANVVAAPFGELIALPACLLHAVVPWWPSLELGLATLGSGALYAVRSVALWSAEVEALRFFVPYPKGDEIATLLVPLLLAAHLARRHVVTEYRKAAPSLMLLVLLLAATSADSAVSSHVAKPQGTLTVTALDVGQGDALLVEFPDGRSALVDGGGYATGFPDTGSRVVLPVLRARDIRHLDLLVLSHPHPDHMNGLISVAAQTSFSRLWLPSGPKGPGTRRLIALARAKGARVDESEALCNQKNTEFAALIEVLAPCQQHHPPLSANDASLVMKISWGQHSALLTGDIERRAEALLVEKYRGRLQADLLKVPHHGSDTSSTPAFLQAVQPTLALISSGIRNRFRHPRRSTLLGLSRLSVATLRTDQLGSISWQSDGSKWRVRSAQPPGAW